MHIRRGFLGWGVFLILAGAIPLAVRAGYISDDQIGRFWDLWPLILVGIGVGLILSRTRFDFVGGLIVAATVGIMVGGLLSVGVGGISIGTCGPNAATTPFPAADGTFTSAADVGIQLNCGELAVGTEQGSAWHLEGTDAKGVGPVVESGGSSLDIRSRNENGASFFGLGDRDTWRLTLPTASPLTLDLHLNAGRATVGLAGASLDDRRPADECRLGDCGSRIRGCDQDHPHAVERRLARLDASEPVDVRLDPGERRRRPAVRAARCRPAVAHGRIDHRELRLRRPRPGPGRLDVDDARLRQRARQDRARDRKPTPARSPWTRRTAVDDRLYRSRDDRMLAGVAGGVAELSMRTRRSSGSSGRCSSS